MRALVTGAAGFVGSHITDRLLAEGQQVVGIDNFETGHTRNVHDSARVIRGDIADRNQLWDAFRLSEPDVVFHCAASYKDGTAWRRDLETNAIGSALVAQLAAEYDARIIYFQTALCYGHHPKPIADLDRDYNYDTLTVSQPLAPDNSYSISKTAGESYIASSGAPYVSIRMANVYGPRNLSGPIPTFAKNLIEGRTSVVADSRRDFIYIDDLLDLVWRVLGSDYVGVLHAASGRDYPISQAYGCVEVAFGKTARMEQIPRAPGDAPSILLDPSETERLFGWKATTSLVDGVASAVSWYIANPPEKTFTHLPIPAAA